MLTSSSSFAVIGHRTLELHYFIFILFYFILFNSRTRKKIERRQNENGGENTSEVGFEPGTFRSCVAHSIHYATETPPIPDALLVLVAPKHINRNGTTTLQSRFTPTPTPRATPHSSPKFGLYRFFNSFLQNPHLLTWRIWG